MTVATPSLPGNPGTRLQSAWNAMNEPTRAVFRVHLLGDTSAEYLADWLGRSGTAVSASTIRTYRRSMRRSGAGHE
jgi:hypothetical protein